MEVDFQLGGWVVRPRQARIESRAGTVHIKPKSMAVLECLARAAGEVVTREQLFDQVWPGGVVTDDVLTQCIVELRKAFGDSARRPRVIETIPKIGFRLIPPVSSSTEEESAPDHEDAGAPAAGERSTGNPPSRVFVLVASTVLMGLVLFWYLSGSREIPDSATLDLAKSIAVLPFVDMSAAGDQGYFADGLTEELINRLAQLGGLEVAGRTSSFYFKGKNTDLRDIGEALGVNYLLEGSVRRDDDRLRITAQLISADDGFHLWSRQFDQPFREIFSVQEDIAESVATALSIKLQVGQLQDIPGSTSSVEAYEELLLSRKHQWESTPDSILLAIEHVRKAIELDPGYALAWWRLAGLYMNASALLGHDHTQDMLLRSERALARARELEPELPGVVFMTAMLQKKNRRWSEVEVTMKHGAGLELSSNVDLITTWGDFLLRVGRVREASPLLERASRIAPYSSKAARALSRVYLAQGRTAEGLAAAQRAFENEGFESWDAEAGLIAALAGDDRQALLNWLDRARQHGLEFKPLYDAMAETLDDHEAALAWLREAFRESKKFDYMIPFWASWHGDSGLALEAMERLPLPWEFWGDPEIRRAPGFRDILRQVGLDSYYREYGWNDFCRPLGAEDFVCE